MLITVIFQQILSYFVFMLITVCLLRCTYPRPCVFNNPLYYPYVRYNNCNMRFYSCHVLCLTTFYANMLQSTDVGCPQYTIKRRCVTRICMNDEIVNLLQQIPSVNSFPDLGYMFFFFFLIRQKRPMAIGLIC